jgi:integrase
VFLGLTDVVPFYPLIYPLVEGIVALTEATIRNAPRRNKPYKLSDGLGLSLIVQPNGSRWWRFRYRFGRKERAVKGKNQEKEKSLSCGVYPETSLREARDRRDGYRTLLRKRIDPAAQQVADRLASGDTVAVVVREYLQKLETPPKDGKSRVLAPVTLEKGRSFLERFILPRLGARPIGQVTVKELYGTLALIEARGTFETCLRTKQWCGKVWRFAVVTGRAARDITPDLRGAFAPVRATNHAAIVEPARIGDLLRAIEVYGGQATTRLALKLAPYVFVRPTELRRAEWREFDLGRAEWRISPAHMKERDPHIVPLSRQAIEILQALRALTGNGKFVFPSVRTAARPMSENTVNAALRTLGFPKDEMTGHGFRTLASTHLNELGIDPEVIELQLAHIDPDGTRRAYNRAQRLPDRKLMMNLWADVLDSMRDQSTRPVSKVATSIPSDCVLGDDHRELTQSHAMPLGRRTLNLRSAALLASARSHLAPVECGDAAIESP